MRDHLMLISLCILFLLGGCSAGGSFALRPEVSAAVGQDMTIVWGLVDLHAIWDIQTGILHEHVPGLLGLSEPSATCTFRDTATGREYVAHAAGGWSSKQRRDAMFAIALPKGQYDLTVELSLPGLIESRTHAQKPIACDGSGNAVTVGHLAVGVRGGNNPFLYDSMEDLDALKARFLADNPDYHGSIAYQAVAAKVVKQ